jgi:hypothetical protein
MVYDHNWQATHCDDAPRWTGRSRKRALAHLLRTVSGCTVRSLTYGMMRILSFAKTPAGFKISKIPQRHVTCYLDEFQTVYAIIAAPSLAWMARNARS